MNKIKADIFDLALSIFASLLNLGYSFCRFCKEARFNGLQLSEYAMSILQ